MFKHLGNKKYINKTIYQKPENLLTKKKSRSFSVQTGKMQKCSHESSDN